MSGAGAARDYFSKAAGASGVAAAQPYLAYAARTFPEAAAEYMNPYTKAVVEQIADIGVKQLQEKYLPAVGEEFIRSGQFGVGPGSTRMGEFGARALRDVQQSVLGEQSKALQAGYGQAADIFARDVERISGIGGKIGQLTGDDASRLAEIGRVAGQLTSADAELLSRIGSTRGELSLKDAENLRALADKYMGAAETEQVLGGREAKTYMDIGEKEREMKQKNLELAYKDFLEQEKDPERKIAFMAEILKSIQLPQTKVVDETTTPGSPGEDPLIKKIITGGAGVNEILELIKKYFPDKETPKGG
jgi:general stress protein YciG